MKVYCEIKEPCHAWMKPSRALDSTQQHFSRKTKKNKMVNSDHVIFVVKACNNKDIMNHQLKITSLINSIVTRKLHEENAYISWWLPFLHLLIFQCTKWALYKIALVKNTISNPLLNRFVFYGIEYKLLDVDYPWLCLGII